MSTCPHCHQSHLQVKDGLTRAGSQRFRCRLCNRRYTPQPKERGASDDLKATAIRLHTDGMNYRRGARHLDVHHQSVINWVTAAAERVPDAPPVPDSVETVELDELHTFVGTKKVVSVITAVDRATRCSVAWSVVAARTMSEMQAVVDQAPQAQQ